MTASPLARHKPLLRLRIGSRKTLLSLFAAALMIATPHVLSAATYTVTNNSGDPTVANSLPWAVLQVNAGAGGDTINFSGVTGTITVTAEMQILKLVTINGP